jgi:hypothetical protein
MPYAARMPAAGASGCKQRALNALRSSDGSLALIGAALELASI